MGPASVSLPDPFPRGPRVTPSLLQNTSRTRVSSGRAISPAPRHTARHPQHLAPLPGCRLPPWDLLGSWVQRARPPLASRGKERHPCPSGRWGDRAGRRPPTSSLCPGSPPAPAWLCLTAPGRAMGCPSPGVGGQLLLGAKPHGAQSHIPRRWPRPTFDLTHSVHFRKSRTLRPPASSLSAPGPLSSLLGSKRQVTDTPCCLQCRGARLQPVFLTLRVVFLLKLPSKMVRGPGPFLPPPPSFYLCFCLQIGVGSSRGAGQHPQPLGVIRRVLARAHLQSWTQPSLSPHQGPHCEVKTALNLLLFYLLNFI